MDPEFEQSAMKAGCSPQRIGATDFSDQMPHMTGNPKRQGRAIEQHEQQLIQRSQADALRRRAAQDDELVSKDEDLDLESMGESVTRFGIPRLGVVAGAGLSGSGHRSGVTFR